MQNQGQMPSPGQAPGGPGGRGEAPGGPEGRGEAPEGRGGRGGGFGGFARPEVPEEYNADRIMALSQPELIKVLQDSGSTLFEKAKACQRLAVIGDGSAVPALAALLTDEELSHYARFGLQPIDDSAADEALRAALPKVSGQVRVGVINSIGHRRDAGALATLTKLISDSDTDAARAAAAAIGRIGGPQAAKVLQDNLSKTRGDVRRAVAAAGLVCADGMMQQGQREEALAFLDTLSRPDIPKAVRLAAMHSTILAEVSLTRPR